MNTELLAPQSGNAGLDAVTPTVDRRDFMTWAVATPAAVAVGVKLATESKEATAAGESVRFNQYISIQNDEVVLTIPRVESGQGILTSLAILAAAEMGIPVEKVRPRSCSTDVITEFTTTLVGASGSTRLLTDPVRAAAAEVKAKYAAANKPLTALQAGAADAARAALSGPVRASAWAYGTGGLLGKGMKINADNANVATFVADEVIPRRDSAAIYNGTHRYTVDIGNEDSLNCLVMHSLQTRGTPKDVQIGKILALKNSEGKAYVKAVIPFNSNSNGFTIYTGVGLVADTMGDALEARKLILKNNLITWNAGTASRFSTPMLSEKLKNAIGPDPALGRLLASKQIRREYSNPFQAQGTLGTQASVAEVFGPAGGGATGAETWWASQVPRYNRHQFAEQIGLDLSPTKVLLHITPGFGHFGRNLLCESSAENALIADQIRRAGGIALPAEKGGATTNKVKIMWSRNDDIRLAPYRPPTFSRFIANIGSDGKSILSMNHKYVSILCELPSGVDNTPTEHLLSLTNQTGFDYFPLATPSVYSFVSNEAFREVVAPFPTGAMRAVYSVSAVGNKEMFMDEVARATGQDPFALRKRYMKSERVRGLMNVAEAQYTALKSQVDAHNASATNTTFQAIGLGLHEEWNSASFTIIKSEVARNANLAETPPRISDVWGYVDMGKITNPSGASAMIEGAVADAVALGYFSKITFVDGAAQQSTFLDYYWNRMGVCNYTFHPATFVNINDNRVGGAGELSAPSAFGAVMNAFAALNALMPEERKHPTPGDAPLFASPAAPRTDL